MLLIKEGAIRVSTNGKESTSSVGSIYIYPPNVLHQESCVSSVDLQICGVVWRQPFAPPSRRAIQAFDATGDLGRAIDWLNTMYFRVGCERWVLNDLLALILHEVSRLKPNLAEDRFHRIRQHIEQNLPAALTVRRLARVMSMSESHFAHEFKREMGMSPISYVRKIRLEHACRALSHGNTVFREIARQVGFRDENELSRVFRRTMGFSPGSLRLNAPRTAKEEC